MDFSLPIPGRDRFFDLSVDLLAIASVRDGRWKRVNSAFTHVLGWSERELLAMPFFDIVHPDDLPRSQDATADLGAGVPLQDFEHRLRCKDGSYKWIAWNTAPWKQKGLIYCVGRDVSERRRFEERQRVLIDELNHRAKNTLTVVQAIVGRTLSGAAVDPAVCRTVRERLSALARSHDLICRENWNPAEFGELARDILQAFADASSQRICIEGPAVRLTANQSVALALVLHELATNAAKYGALSCTGGAVRLTWQVADGPLRLRWREQGGPPVAAPETQGFGSQLIRHSLTLSHGDAVRLSFPPDGVTCEIDLTLEPAASD